MLKASLPRAARYLVYFILTLVIGFSTLIIPATAFAQESEETKVFGNTSLLDDYLIRQYTTQHDDEYVKPNLQNLSKLYWTLGKLDFSNNTHIDDYLRIHECDLYTRFFHNDFEWSQIRSATRQHIQHNLANFPTTFEITNVLQVGRYNEDREFFELEPSSKIMGLRRVAYSMDGNIANNSCLYNSYIKDYPLGLVVILNRPITLDRIYVKPELAKMYIEESKRQFKNFPASMQIRIYERLAYLRLKIRVLQYKETLAIGSNRDIMAVVFGRVEGYEIYADPEMEKPLYSHVFDDRSTRRRVVSEPENKLEGIVPEN